ncbi:IS4 family transposase [Methanoplanus limicola]|uniref:Transposase IS4 family protein n=1 Tax=Methanoplanus limicola DSM 2279 TaxID=937775 RepID=H1YZZ7_9EURY|nr:IS4 family transposase [Methanoplanus limicola]EHQ35204.1 transposase IS4 family protein [Methanoplanus limicola DSM 2279]
MSLELEQEGLKIKEILEKYLNVEEIYCAATRTGFITRERKTDPFAFLFALVLGRFSQDTPSIVKYNRIYNSLSGKDHSIEYNSFYDRFDESCLSFINECLDICLNKAMSEASAELYGHLRKFKDLLIQDNSIVRIHPSFSEKYPATRTRSKAARIKIACLFSELTNSPAKVTLSAENTNDNKTLEIGPWIKDKLLLIDRGFFKHETFANIMENEGFFISRVKKTSKPRIKELGFDIPEHLREKCYGKTIFEAMEILKGRDIDANVTLNYPVQNSNGKRDLIPFELRFIAIYNEEKEDYHTYLTNLSREYKAKTVSDLYSLRWDIELLFKEMKSEYGLGKIKTKNEYLMEIAIKIPILTLIISRKLFWSVLELVDEKDKKDYRITKWARIFAENSIRILRTYFREIFPLDKENEWDWILRDLIRGTRTDRKKRKYLTMDCYH